MRLPLYQVDAFAARRFTGNPAAVVPLPEWLPDGVLQAVAAENNLSETAFFVRTLDGWHLRWFTPAQEVDLCGHATLASAHVLLEVLQPDLEAVTFQTRSGPLAVTRGEGGLLSMDFPTWAPRPILPPPGIEDALGATPLECLLARDLVCVLPTEEMVAELRPDMARLAALDLFGIVPTARASTPGVDFVSRWFGPRVGVPEDPVTGSAHTELVPYWAEELGKTRLTARQLSARGGELECELLGERTRIAGRSVLVLEGVLHLDD